MKTCFTITLALTIALLSSNATAAEKNEIPAGFTKIFNGKDLTGWKIPKGDNDHWKVVDGVIDYDARSEAKGNKNLWTQESYGDFELLLDWRFKETTGLYAMPTILPDGSEKKDANGKVIKVKKPNADSGIYLRGTTHQLNLWCWDCGSGEMWSVRRNKKLTPEQRAAAVPKVKADKPVGQWNKMKITMKGDSVTAYLNDKLIIENAQIPKIPKEGPIGIQHHGGYNAKTKNTTRPPASSRSATSTSNASTKNTPVGAGPSACPRNPSIKKQPLEINLTQAASIQ